MDGLSLKVGGGLPLWRCAPGQFCVGHWQEKGACICLTFRWRFIAPRSHFLCRQAYEFSSRMSLRQLLTMFLNASMEIFAVISIASYLVNSVFSTIHPCQINRGEMGSSRVI
ncbi:hypothetical protein [Delftia acidovorans]|uniref:hypothetical protein n=1 Tax=Delftia acidovorans TaxID=80866 RepID=UPI00286EE388|nr:hypothetical protein [Delftia acidovorans]